MPSGEGKSQAAMADPRQHPQPQPQLNQYPYGTFGVPDYSQPVIGVPQPVAPPGVGVVVAPSAPTYPPYSPRADHYYMHGYQTVPVYAPIAEVRTLRLRRLPCCGMGLGWFLFIAGFFLAAVPWYVGAFVLLCVRIDFREKPGFVACTIAAVLFALAVFLGVKKEAW
ncbi:60S ribosomal protein L18a-like protein [Canna indica]|uniref:60S ribosomal protein L18a-like protein n=1 Tax=Canna indica TaxID=4628 RepID=A0AAQ3JKJ4_9LILI|nr:60S ribosomal protein L18a-like protein [Canna indica]